MDAIEAIKTRRSIRKYEDTPVTDEQLNTVLEAVQWSPSWANTQCWEIIVVKDAAVKEKLAATLSPGNPSTDAIKNAPIVIAACARKGKSGFYKDTPLTNKGDWLMYDVGLAMQNLCIAAQALGLGTVQIGANCADETDPVQDTNGDGVCLEDEEEFMEIVNTESFAVDIGNYRSKCESI